MTPWMTFVLLFGGLLLLALAGALLGGLRKRMVAGRAAARARDREAAETAALNQSILRMGMVAILVVDQDGAVIFSNPEARRLFAVEEDEIKARPLERWITNMSVARLKAIAGRGGDKTAGKYFSAKSSNGAALVLDIRADYWLSPDDQERFTVMLRDATVLSEIATAQERWDRALKSAGIGIFDVDLRHGRSVVTETWKTMFGFDPKGEIDSQAEWESRIHPEDKPRVFAADQACVDGKAERTDNEYRFLRADGKWIWTRSNAVVTEWSSDGKALRMIGVQSDITALKEAEEALRSSETRFRNAIENAPMPMVITDEHGHCLNANRAFKDFIGYGLEDVRGESFLAIVHPDDGGQKEGGLDLVQLDRLRDGEVRAYEVEMRFVHKNGSDRWGYLTVSIDRDANGAPLYFIIQIKDITEQKGVDQIKSDFVATVSHELRTPLTSIHGALRLLQDTTQGKLPQGTDRLLSIAQTNSKRLISLVNDILDLEKISSSDSVFKLAPRDICKLTRGTVEANMPLATDSGVTLNVVHDAESCFANVDETRFSQVLTNLISNAVKFSPEGGVVEIALETDAETLRIVVTDQGPGIPEDFEDKIFQRFSQADSSSTRKKGGTGLGLFISKLMVEKMGGQIGFISGRGEGACFWITFPLEKPVISSAAGDEPAPVEPQRSCPPAILHVEDDADFSEVLTASFKERAKIFTATHLSEARVMIGKRPFDLIIIDWDLPDGNGRALIPEIAQVNGDTPVIGLSSSEPEWEDEHVLHHLVKTRTSVEDIVQIALSTIHP